MDSFDTTNTTAKIREEHFWMIVSCVSITSTVMEILILVVSCVYYRRRIDRLNKKMPTDQTGTGIMRHNVERQSKARKSLAVSIMRYVMEPTSSGNQFDDSSYSYATQGPYLEMNTRMPSQDNRQVEIPTVEQAPGNPLSNYEEVSPVLSSEKKHEGVVEVASEKEKETISKKIMDPCGSSGSENGETTKRSKTASRDEITTKSNTIKTKTIATSYSYTTKTNRTGQRKHSDAYLIDDEAKGCYHESVETEAKQIREDNYSEYTTLSSESNAAESKDKSVKESKNLGDCSYMNVDLAYKGSYIDRGGCQMRDCKTDVSVGETGGTEKNQNRDSDWSGSSENSNSSEISVKANGQFEKEYSQHSTERYVNVTLNIAQVVGDVHMGPCRVYKSDPNL